MSIAAEPAAEPDVAPAVAGAGQPGPIRRMLGLVWTGLLFRWVAFFGFIVSASNCPFCGRPGCPQGLATAGVAAGILAAFSRRRHRHGSGPESPKALPNGQAGPLPSDETDTRCSPATTRDTISLK